MIAFCMTMGVCNVFPCRKMAVFNFKQHDALFDVPKCQTQRVVKCLLTESLEPSTTSRVPFPPNRPCPTCQPRRFLLLYVRSTQQGTSSDTVSYVAGHKGPTVLREPRQLSGRGPPAPNAGMQPGVSQHRLFS